MKPVIKVAPTKTFVVDGSSVTIDSADALLLRDYLLYAIESLNAVILLAERNGASVSLLQLLEEYASDAATLRDKLQP